MIVQTRSADVLSDILATVQARARCSISLTAGGPWSLAFPMPSHLKFNAVRRGQCWLRLEGQAPVLLVKGDCFVVAGSGFVLSSAPDLSPIPAREVFSTDSMAATVGSGDEVSILGGSVEVGGIDGLLLTQALPPVLTIQGDRASSMAWLLAELDREWNSPAPGARLISNDLLRLLFVQALRSHLTSGGSHVRSWLAGLGNANIARALQAIHGNPAQAWTVASLAQEAGQSRSAFAERFKALLGEAPMEYLARWRMRLAAAKLRDTSASIAEIAGDVGYTSDSALSAAFRRLYAMSPARYRRANSR